MSAPQPPMEPEDRSNLQRLLVGLSAETRAEILSALRYAGIRDNDPMLVILAVVRQHDRQLADLCAQVLAAIDKAPGELRDAAAALSLAKADHEEDVVAFRKAAEQFREAQGSTLKLLRRVYKVCIFAGLVAVAGTGMIVYSILPNNELTAGRDGFIAAVRETRVFQMLAGSRLVLFGAQHAQQLSWARLEADVQKWGETEELREQRQKLMDRQEVLDRRFQVIRDKEREILKL